MPRSSKGGGMAASYEVITWGESVSGRSDPHFCTISGIGKRVSGLSPYAAQNEYIAGRLALCVGLPVPPGVLSRYRDGSPAYISLQFGDHTEILPPVIPGELVSRRPDVAAGIVAFDCWVANEDRHESNIWYSEEYPTPMVFDFDDALLGAEKLTGMARLASLENVPVVGGCIAPLIEDWSHFRVWTARIAAVRDDIIAGICDDVRRTGILTVEECSATERFLVARKSSLMYLLNKGSSSMPLVRPMDML
jgi:hypothetical protein